MRIATSALLVGAASAVNLQQDTQHVISDAADKVKEVASSWADKVKDYEAVFGSMTSEAKALWDEVEMLVPNAFDALPPLTKPKKHERKPDSKWDFVTKGADVQALWTENTADAESHRVVGGDLEAYNLRTKAVDPSKLGVDTVKQYSGYLDDEANDKHLFYCTYTATSHSALPRPWLVSLSRLHHHDLAAWTDSFTQGSLSRVMTPRRTPSSSGSTAARAARP